MVECEPGHREIARHQIAAYDNWIVVAQRRKELRDGPTKSNSRSAQIRELVNGAVRPDDDMQHAAVDDRDSAQPRVRTVTTQRPSGVGGVGDIGADKRQIDCAFVEFIDLAIGADNWLCGRLYSGNLLVVNPDQRGAEPVVTPRGTPGRDANRSQLSIRGGSMTSGRDADHNRDPRAPPQMPHPARPHGGGSISAHLAVLTSIGHRGIRSDIKGCSTKGFA